MADDIVTELREADCDCELCWEVSFHTLNRRAADEIERLYDIGDALAEQIMLLLGPLSTDADPVTVERHQVVRNGALRQWAEVRRG